MSLPPMAYYTVAKKPNLGYHDFKNLFNFEAKTLRPCGICSPPSFLFVWSTITQLFSSTVHTRNKQWTAVDKSLLHQEIRISPKKIFEAPWLKTQGSWVRSANVTSVLCRLPHLLPSIWKWMPVLIFLIQVKILDEISGHKLFRQPFCYFLLFPLSQNRE